MFSPMETACCDLKTQRQKKKNVSYKTKTKRNKNKDKSKRGSIHALTGCDRSLFSELVPSINTCIWAVGSQGRKMV